MSAVCFHVPLLYLVSNNLSYLLLSQLSILLWLRHCLPELLFFWFRLGLFHLLFSLRRHLFIFILILRTVRVLLFLLLLINVKFSRGCIDAIEDDSIHEVFLMGYSLGLPSQALLEDVFLGRVERL